MCVNRRHGIVNFTWCGHVPAVKSRVYQPDFSKGLISNLNKVLKNVNIAGKILPRPTCIKYMFCFKFESSNKDKQSTAWFEHI